MPPDSSRPFPPSDPIAPATRISARLTAGVLLGSLALRCWLAWRGGQFFWPDEDRFVAAQRAVESIAHGRFEIAAQLLFAQADHLLFRVISLVPAALQYAWGAPAWLPALFFAVASTGVLWLVARAARAAGGSETEAFVALVLAASTSCLFYYSRHYFPYDISLGCLLLAAIAAFRRPPRKRDSWIAGLWAGLGFLAYNGYWSVAAAILMTHVLAGAPRGATMAGRAISAGLGLLLPVLTVVGVGRALGHNLVADSVAFAGTVTQGDLGLAWRFVPEYLWTAERSLAVLWALALPAAVALAAVRRESRLLVWPAVCLLLAGLLIGPSDLLGRFALSARHVRALAPFLCLAAAAALCTPPFRRLVPAIAALAAAQAAFAFAAALTQVFPRDFRSLAAVRLAEARRHDLGPYAVRNADFLHNPRLVDSGRPDDTVLLRRAHPFQFPPYLYEGYSAAARAQFLSGDMSMRVVRLAAGGPAFAGPPPGAIELTLRFPAEPFGLLPEPLLSTGQPRQGDLIFIEYVGTDQFRLGHDNYGGGARFTPVRPLDRSRPHRLYVEMAGWDPRRHDSALVLAWDGEMLFNAAVPMHPTQARQIDVGHNFQGFSTAMPLLSAAIESVDWRVPIRADSTFRVPPAAIRLDIGVHHPPAAPALLPLMQTGNAELGDKLFLRLDPDGSGRIGLDHRGAGFTWSAPFPVAYPSRLDLVVAATTIDSAPPSPPGQTARPPRLHVSVNGQGVMDRIARLHPTQPEEILAGLRQPHAIALFPQASADVRPPAVAPTPPTLAPPPAFPGAVRFTLRFFEPPVPGRNQPLMSAGRTGAADVVLLRFDAADRFRIGLDHWGSDLLWSEPVAIAPGQPLDLTIALGSLFDPAAGPGDAASALRGRLVVLHGDAVVLDRRTALHAPLAGSLVIGANTVGASSAEPELAADLLAYRTLPAQEILSLLARP